MSQSKTILKRAIPNIGEIETYQFYQATGLVTNPQTGEKENAEVAKRLADLPQHVAYETVASWTMRYASLSAVVAAVKSGVEADRVSEYLAEIDEISKDMHEQADRIDEAIEKRAGSVVNLEDAPYGYKIETFYFAPYFMELFLELKKLDSLCFLVTNQSGINRGIFTQKDFEVLSAFMQNCIVSCLTIPLRQSGFVPKNIAFDGIYFCPHTKEENCTCRKPKSQMLLQACKDFGLDLSLYESYILGDKDTDMIAGLNAGVQTRIIVGKGESQNATHRVKNLKEALEILID